MPVLCFGQDELDSIAMANRIDSIWQIARQQLEYMSSGNAKRDNKDFYGAISDYTKAIELNPDSEGNSGFFYFRGFSKYVLGDNNGAIAYFSKSIELKADFEKSYHFRGRAKSEIKDYIGAFNDICKAIELNPNDDSYYSFRGLLLSIFNLDNTYLCEDYKKACDLGNGDACKWYDEKCN